MTFSMAIIIDKKQNNVWHLSWRDFQHLRRVEMSRACLVHRRTPVQSILLNILLYKLQQ